MIKRVSKWWIPFRRLTIYAVTDGMFWWDDKKYTYHGFAIFGIGFFNDKPDKEEPYCGNYM